MRIAEDLRKHIDRHPFVPFDIELNSGTKIRVSHPENVFTKGDLVVVSAGQELIDWFWAGSVCSIHIVRNGRRRNGR